MSDAILQVRNLTKIYSLYDRPIDRLKEALDPRRKKYHRDFYALNDISFDVKRGETLGIIGKNGSGKSTLLKIISGVLASTSGAYRVNGNIASLLELGTGFNPELTGIENVYFNGTLFGLSKKEIDGKLDSIVEFADIGEFVNQPVKLYSSGMFVRLAFSVAVNLDPEILIVDEALSVGDTYFQHKSFERIRQLNRRGTTLLIVSHDKNAILSICDSVILLNAGAFVMQDEPETVMDYYNAILSENTGSIVRQKTADGGKIQTISGTREAVVEDVALLDAENNRVETVNVGQQVRLRIVVRSAADIEHPVIGYMIKDRFGQSVFGTNTCHLEHDIVKLRRGEPYTLDFKFGVDLGEGSYSVAVALHTAETHITKSYEWRDLALVFKVVNADKSKFAGVAWLPPSLECGNG
jgi:lipopolysaccharide transport system ATP-binding protein